MTHMAGGQAGIRHEGGEKKEQNKKGMRVEKRKNKEQKIRGMCEGLVQHSPSTVPQYMTYLSGNTE